SVTIPASPFMQKLGYGTGVNVYLMKRSPRGLSRSPWAVKKINPKCSRTQQSLYQQRLNDEAKILKGLQHPNIVAARRCPRGVELGMWGQEGCGIGLSPPKFSQIGSGEVFQGQEVLEEPLRSYLPSYLSSYLLSPLLSPILSPRSVWHSFLWTPVALSLPPKCVGFLAVSDPQGSYIGTEPWKPKEALQDEGVITDKADIFAFGLTLWEMMTLAVPHLNLGGGTDDEDESFDEDDFDEEAYYAALGTRPALNMEELDPSYQRMIELFSICTSEEPQKRPSAAHIVAALEASLP
ncbi:Lymphokine-activated killer T-cell-originated protein kinase, partial [Anas platyrhynchos]